MKYRQVLRIPLDNGFEQARQRGSHRTYKGVVGGQMRIVTLSHHSLNEDVLPKTLASIIRQSGLPRSMFR